MFCCFFLFFIYFQMFQMIELFHSIFAENGNFHKVLVGILCICLFYVLFYFFYFYFLLILPIFKERQFVRMYFRFFFYSPCAEKKDLFYDHKETMNLFCFHVMFCDIFLNQLLEFPCFLYLSETFSPLSPYFLSWLTIFPLISEK